MLMHEQGLFIVHFTMRYSIIPPVTEPTYILRTTITCVNPW